MGANQISGSLSLDVSALAGQIRDEVIRSLSPHLEQMFTQLDEISEQRGPQVLSANETASALYDTGLITSDVMDVMAARLISSGYALVRTTPERIEGVPAEQVLYAVDEAKIPVVDLPPDEEHSAVDHRVRPLWRRG